MGKTRMLGVLMRGNVPIYFTWDRKLRGPRWRKARRRLRREAQRARTA